MCVLSLGFFLFAGMVFICWGFVVGFLFVWFGLIFVGFGLEGGCYLSILQDESGRESCCDNGRIP